MLKALLGVAAVQTALLIFISFRLADLDARLDADQTILPTVIAQPRDEAATPNSLQAGSGPELAEIRAVVREELASLRSTTAAHQQAAPATAPVQRADPILRGDVARDLDRYIGRGRISPQEMADFQSKMAQLPAAERSEMLRALTKAMNDGRLEGQF